MKEIITYNARDGQEITLGFDIVRKYLVQGKAELVTNQEIVFFMGICKARGLNPFKKDCYLIKYSNDPAAIVTSIDYFRSRAKSQNNCRGWKKGIIVQKPDGTIRDSYGLILSGEQLVGGFFETKPDGWDEPFRLEVNLDGYIKRKTDGSITSFWQPKNQPTQIAKVAESQGLRTVWPDEFQGLYEQSEIAIEEPPKIPNTIPVAEIPEANLEDQIRKFDESIPKEVDAEILSYFLFEVALSNGCSVDEVKAEASGNMKSFWNNFIAWSQKQETPQKETVQQETNVEGYDLEFTGMKAEALKAYEELHRQDIDSWPEDVQEAFKKQWKKVTKNDYADFLSFLSSSEE